MKERTPEQMRKALHYREHCNGITDLNFGKTDLEDIQRKIQTYLLRNNKPASSTSQKEKHKIQQRFLRSL